jgi:hypothetical protein
MIDITGCPIGVAVNGVGQTYPELLWKSSRQGYGLVTVGERLRVEVRETNTASVLFACEFEAGSNAPIFADAVTAVRIT